MIKNKPKHLTSIRDLTKKEIENIVSLAVELKKEFKKIGKNKKLLEGKIAGMIFQKPSTRTRVSFEVAMNHLGGSAIYLSSNDIQLSRGETIADTSRVLSRYVDCIIARVFNHSDIEQLAEFADVPVINALSDFSHPCQILGDLLTIYEKLGTIKDFKITYVGDGNNVCNSLIFACGKVGFSLTVASPDGYKPDKQVIDYALKDCVSSGGKVEILTDPFEAVKNSDVIYTDVWASMGQEAEKEKRAKIFKPYQVNSQLLSAAKKDTFIMHCLPAHRGEEITNEVIDGKNSIVFDQAENRLHIQKAILLHLFNFAL